MANAVVDFAVLGSTPFASVLAASLALDHGAKVCLFCRVPPALGISRQLDIAAGAYVRPETHRLLAHAEADVMRVLGGIATDVTRRVDVAFLSHTARGEEALAHARQLALAFGQQAEVHPGGLAEGMSGYLVRGVRELSCAGLTRRLASWLANAGVDLCDARSHSVEVTADGGANVAGPGSKSVAAGRAVLADADMILDILSPGAVSERFAVRERTAISVGPGALGRWPGAVEVDAAAAMWGAPDGGIGCAVEGGVAEAAAWLRGMLVPGSGDRLAGMIRFKGLSSLDGAPVVGEARGRRAFVAHMPGPAEVFFAPAVARLLAGASSEQEAEYFAARAPGATRSVRIAEHLPAHLGRQTA